MSGKLGVGYSHVEAGQLWRGERETLDDCPFPGRPRVYTVILEGWVQQPVQESLSPAGLLKCRCVLQRLLPSAGLRSARGQGL